MSYSLPAFTFPGHEVNSSLQLSTQNPPEPPPAARLPPNIYLREPSCTSHPLRSIANETRFMRRAVGTKKPPGVLAWNSPGTGMKVPTQ